LPRVLGAELTDEISNVSREEFERWFGLRLRIESAAYEELADGIFAIIERYR
jgi:hypothetical protein